MDYERKYKELAGKIKKAYLYAQTDSTKAVLENLLPELKESKDEQIRKELFDFLTYGIWQSPAIDKVKQSQRYVLWLSWLEKQGNLMKALQTSNARIGELIEENYYLKEQLEKQSEQKSIWAEEDEDSNVNDETNAPTEYGKYVDECLNEAAKHFFSDGEDTYSVADLFYAGVRCGKTWIEKQGEQKQDPCEHCKDKCLNCHDFPCIEKREFELSKTALEVIKEVKADNANKVVVEPKFKVGDFIVNDYCMGRVVELTNDAYLLDTEQGIPFSCEHNVHLWTIEDAKEGDVLYSPCLSLLWIFKSRDTVYCGCNLNYNDGVFCGEGYFKMPTDAIPSTKEQRDLLFQKMNEAGYEWDFETKKLKTFNSYCQEHCKGYQETGKCYADGECEAKKNAETGWSEEDKKMSRCIGNAITADDASTYLESKDIQVIDAHVWLDELKDRVQQKQAWSEDDKRVLSLLFNNYKQAVEHRPSSLTHAEVLDIYNWLKSLKGRYTWKPTKAMLDALNWAKSEFHPDCVDTMDNLNYLYKELEQLYYDGN